jgi:hypothetical protein
VLSVESIGEAEAEVIVLDSASEWSFLRWRNICNLVLIPILLY